MIWNPGEAATTRAADGTDTSEVTAETARSSFIPSRQLVLGSLRLRSLRLSLLLRIGTIENLYCSTPYGGADTVQRPATGSSPRCIQLTIVRLVCGGLTILLSPGSDLG